MKTPQYRNRSSLEFNMTPMIDVTFLLIIFFLVSNNMAQQETQVAVDLPIAAMGDDEQDDAKRVTVNLTSDGTMLVAGEAIDAAALGNRLAVERSRTDELEVRIRCDRRAPYGRVKPVMRECLKNDVWKVTFAVIRAE